MIKLKWVTIIGFNSLLILILGVANSGMFSAEAAGIDSLKTTEINIVKGEVEAIRVYGLTRVSVTDPAIADIANTDENEILVVGKAPGGGMLFVWDEHGKRALMINVFNQKLDLIQSRLEQLFKAAQIEEINLEANEHEGKIVLSGDIPTHKRGQYDQVIEPFNQDIINLVKDEEIEDMVQVDMQVTELNTTLSKNLGIEWSSQGTGTGSPSLLFNYREELPDQDGSIGDWFKLGNFTRANAIQATVNALVEEGKARILSKPKLVVISGEEARFLVGGEIPITTTSTTASGGLQENVSYKQFGIGMTITPTIKKGKVDVLLNVEVSDVDASNTVGNDVAFSTRTANTHLLLNDGQMIILAGLIKHNESEIVSKVPFLGSVPFLGVLFRNKSSPVPEQDQELVISLTPHILKDQEATSTQLTPSDTPPVETTETSSPEVATEVASTIEPIKEAQEYNTVLLRNEPILEKVSQQSLEAPQEMNDYVYTIQQKISHAITYPPEAIEYGWEGTVKLGLLILKDGTLAFAIVKESSGYEVFDEYALNTVKNSAPYTGFPSSSELQELNITIPIVYSLQRNNFN